MDACFVCQRRKLEAEIERLTHYVEAFRREEARADKYGGELDDKDNRIEQLEAALKEIGFGQGLESLTPEEGHLKEIARTALAGKSHT